MSARPGASGLIVVLSGRTQPDRDRGGRDRRAGRLAEVHGHRRHVDFMAKADREGGGSPLGVVVAAVEAPIDHALHPPADRLEEGEDRQRRRGDGDRLALGELRQDRREKDDDATEDDREDPRDDGVADRSTDDPVDLEESVPKDGEAHRDGDQRRCPRSRGHS